MSKFKPFIAVGHGLSTDGSWDTGCTWNGFRECDLAKEVVAGILEVFDQNQKSYVTDYPENNMNIVNCVATANAQGCSHYLSVHLDWDQAPSGIYPIYVSESGRQLAEAIRASMMLRIPGLRDRGNLCRADYEVQYTDMPAVIMEVGSIKADNELIRNNARLFGHSIAYGMLDYAGEIYGVIGQPQEPQINPVPAQAPIDPQANTIAVTSSGFNWETSHIQTFLNICNYGAPDIDGIWGPETQACLMNAQRAYGITVDGICGPVTQANAEAQIRQYQTKLESLGYSCGGVDGIAGPQTLAAVKAFQTANGLEVDGIVGEKTFAKLFGEAKAYTPLKLKNFSEDEFKCNCGCGGDILDELKIKIQALRDLLSQRAQGDRPLIITSGFRCPTENARAGGVPNSLHMKGRACDLYTPGMSRAMVDEIAYCAQQVGLGTLKYYQSLFVHVQLDQADEIMEA